jgi:VWFA-related protein
MPRFLTLFLILALASAQPPAPQALQSSQDHVIRITVNLVQVDAVVVDSKDRPVTNLKKEDFVILQDGKSQAITNFSFVTTKPEGVRTTSAPTRQAPAPKGMPAPPPPPSRAISPTKAGRTVALVVDDLGLSFESISRIRGSLKKFVDQDMQPGDLVAVIRTGAGMGALQQFTNDKRILYAAIDKVKYNSLGRVGISSFAPLQGIDPETNIDTTNADNEREQIFSAGTMGAIQYVVQGLGELPGRKSVILFSEHMKINYQDGQSQRVLDGIRRLTDAANRASVVIYTIDPRGLVYTGLTAADNTRGRTAQQISNVSMERSQQMWDSQDGLVRIANETGGLFLHDSNDIDGMVRKVVEDGEGYYLIGYHPESSTFDAKTGQPKFHSLSVRVKQPGLHVRYRSGFFGTSDRQTAPIARTREAQIAHAISSPFGTGALHLRLTSLFAQSANNGPFVRSLLHFEPSQLKFTDEPDDWHKAVIDTVALTFGDSGEVVNATDKTWTIRVKGETYKDIVKKGMVYQINVPIKKPGAYQLRVVLRDAGSEQVGSASQFIEVPDVSKGHLTLSSVVLSADAPRAQSAPGTPAGTTAEHREGQVDEPDPNGTPAVRIFKPGTPISYAYWIFNAQADNSKKPELEVQTRLFRDGQQVYSGTPKPLEAGVVEDPKRLMGGGRLQLGPNIAVGDYVLQVIVTDKLAKEKYSMASQSMDFEIRP